MSEIRELYEKMYQEMGPQGWWPAESKVEIILGAILVHNTNWKNVEMSLQNLQENTDFEVNKLLALPQTELEDLIRPSGFYKNKSRTILGALEWFETRQWHYRKIASREGQNLRKELLKIHGIGEETADVFLVYLFDQPTLIADNYACKLFKAFGYKGIDNYTKLKAKVLLPGDFTSEEAQEFHGLIDEFGKVYLKKPELFEESFLGEWKKRGELK